MSQPRFFGETSSHLCDIVETAPHQTIQIEPSMSAPFRHRMLARHEHEHMSFARRVKNTPADDGSLDLCRNIRTRSDNVAVFQTAATEWPLSRIKSSRRVIDLGS
jgi:hypothetical protein